MKLSDLTEHKSNNKKERQNTGNDQASHLNLALILASNSSLVLKENGLKQFLYFHICKHLNGQESNIYDDIGKDDDCGWRWQQGWL